ncbi:MAG: DUF3024 domain-containing protein [Candidatus Thiodiazotropha sp.]
MLSVNKSRAEMAFSEIEKKRHEKKMDEFLRKRRPPPHVRKEVDLGYRLEGQSIEIFEIRPLWNNPNELIEEQIAKATYVKSQKTWKIFWQRADLKWHRYDPDPEVDSIDDYLRIVENDELACFWG